MKDVFLKYWKLFFFAFAVCAMVAIVLCGFLGDVLAQPGLPGDPEQTPIDSGLGILAALGGTYAIKNCAKKGCLRSDLLSISSVNHYTLSTVLSSD